jgi:hypothetical protein
VTVVTTPCRGYGRGVSDGDPERDPRLDPELDALEAASALWPVALEVRFRPDVSPQAIGDFLDTLRLEDLPGEVRLTTDVDARRSTVAFAPWTRPGERTRWERRLRDDRLVDEVTATA